MLGSALHDKKALCGQNVLKAMVLIHVSIYLNIPVILFVILFITVSCVLFLSQQCSESVVRSHLCYGFLDQPVFAYLLKNLYLTHF